MCRFIGQIICADSATDPIKCLINDSKVQSSVRKWQTVSFKKQSVSSDDALV